MMDKGALDWWSGWWRHGQLAGPWQGMSWLPSSHYGQKGQRRIEESSEEIARVRLETLAPETLNQGKREELGVGGILMD